MEVLVCTCVCWLGRAAERTKMKHGHFAKQLLKGTPKRRTHLGGSGGMLPREIFQMKVARIALVPICASKYNYHIIEPASHYAQES